MGQEAYATFAGLFYIRIVIRVFVSAVLAILAAPLPASAAILSAAVPRIPAAPLVVLGSAVAPAALSAGLSSQLAPMPAAISGTPAAALASLPAAADAPNFPEDPNAPPAVSAAPLGAGLKMAKGEHEEWLGSVVGLLSGTRTGRRILRDIDALSASRGRPVLLDVKAIGNNGEFRYDSDLLVMDAKHLKLDPSHSAPILAHELQHVLQRAQELPTDALELEVESYTIESRVWSELGVEPEAGTFARDARRRLAKDLPGFVEWLKRQYNENIPLYGSSLDAYAARLEKKLAAANKAEAKTRRKREAVLRTLQSMRDNGMSDAAIEAHRREDLEPLDRSLRDGALNRAWIERDLRLLADPAGRERFRAYARGVIRRARSLSSDPR